MKYSKPEIVKLEDAAKAIQGQTSKTAPPADQMPSNSICTASAYESDE